MPTETPNPDWADPGLDEAHIEALAGQGARHRTQTGEVLIRQGEEHYDFVVVLSGKAVDVEGSDGDERVIGVHGPGRFLGELSLITGQAAFCTSRVDEPGDVLRVPVDRLKAVIVQDSTLADLILKAYLTRRSLLIGRGAGLRIIGSRFSPDNRRLREFAARNRIPHHWLDLEQDQEAEALLRGLQVRPEDTPMVICPSGQVLRNPSNAQLARAVGLPAPRPGVTVCDLAVVGAGPAGLAAAVYGASEGLVTVTLDEFATGGQAARSSRIENYPGFPAGISGGELAERAVVQAEKFGAAFNVPARACGLEERDGNYVIALDNGGEVTTRTVLIATGAQYRKLDVPRFEEFEASSVYYAATLSEALFCHDDPVAVVGGGNSAGQAALFLSRYARVVHLLARRDLGETMSRYLIDRIETTPSVQVHLRTEVRELLGDDTLEGLVVQDVGAGQRRELPARALFVFIGAAPCTGWLAGRLVTDRDGFILTGPDSDEPGRQGRPLLQTSLPGVFAAGDVRSGSIKRVTSAVGEGAAAVQLAWKHLQSIGRAADDGTAALTHASPAAGVSSAAPAGRGGSRPVHPR
ncbi:FAD-dependent oxidoreductase [Dactylosporangium vinaceum]|uniref:FAD-dependent oxidoreductase n=1 Tax=Dactylosporangium vinaceum TaxID=53362 RepID=A0ABV5M959_9ACTN|nr:cyclic nucleotide-binding domain-containing thioredoxin-disulfide reductase [Dactylosporangium vinaceum]UAC01696.1 FAD-dependent oxidoreductase [Dactylosporangium vinaceum]